MTNSWPSTTSSNRSRTPIGSWAMARARVLRNPARRRSSAFPNCSNNIPHSSGRPAWDCRSSTPWMANATSRRETQVSGISPTAGSVGSPARTQAKDSKPAARSWAGAAETPRSTRKVRAQPASRADRVRTLSEIPPNSDKRVRCSSLLDRTTVFAADSNRALARFNSCSACSNTSVSPTPI